MAAAFPVSSSSTVRRPPARSRPFARGPRLTTASNVGPEIQNSTVTLAAAPGTDKVLLRSKSWCIRRTQTLSTLSFLRFAKSSQPRPGVPEGRRPECRETNSGTVRVGETLCLGDVLSDRAPMLLDNDEVLPRRAVGFIITRPFHERFRVRPAAIGTMASDSIDSNRGAPARIASLTNDFARCP